MSNEINNIDEHDWEELILQLTTFAKICAERKAWFRGGKSATTFLGGKLARDYAMEAIARYLEEPEKFDAEKGDLRKYLEYNLVRNLVRNDANSSENKCTFDIACDTDKDDDSLSYAERLEPYVNELFPDNIDFAAISDFVSQEIKGDEDAENVFLAKTTYDMKPREIMDEFKMSSKAYNNAARRLQTVYKNARQHFSEKGTAV